MRYVLVALAFLAAACSGGAPGAPSTVGPTAPTGAPAPGGTLAQGPSTALSVAAFSVNRLHDVPGAHHYEADLRLASATGVGAWVHTVAFEIPDGDTSTCGGRFRVEPGRTSGPPVWCLDFTSSRPAASVTVAVRFEDDLGRHGEIRATAAVTGNE